MEYFYDHTGVLGFKYNGTSYLYRKDIQGNIIAVLNENGVVEFTYQYDAWGNFKAYDASGNQISSSGRTYPKNSEPTLLCDKNPFKYRGYFYDWQTGLYYLQSCYYDPGTGRFISVDSFEYANPEAVDGLNLYVYCGNNPVMYIDPTGHGFLTFLLGLGISMLTWGVINTATQLGSDLINLALTGDWESGWEEYLGAFWGGLAGGAAFFLFNANLSVTFAIMGGMETLTTSSLTNASGRTNYSEFALFGKTLLSIGIGFAAGKFLGGTKVSGITRGSNSFMAIWKRGLTRLYNATASRMGVKVIMKGLISIAILRSGSALLNGLSSSIIELLWPYIGINI